MNVRLKVLRKALDLTQQEFGKLLGVKGNTIAQYEMGRTIPSNAIIFSICREFNVNECWLRDGTGKMFLPVDRNTEIAKLTKILLNEESDSFKNRLVGVLANLTEGQWELLADIADGLTKRD